MTQVAEAPEPGLRERKKRATRRALQRAALRLVSQKGLDEVTVEEIATAADVSPRTFFNYFATKEEALSALDPDAVADNLAAIADRPAGEPPLQVLRTVYVTRIQHAAQDTEFWQLRARVSKDYPDLMVSIMGASVIADMDVGLALAERMGVDIRRDPRPLLLAGIANAARRTAIHLWMASGHERDLASTLNECFDALTQLGDAA